MTVATLVALIGLNTMSHAQTTVNTTPQTVRVVSTDAKKFRVSLPVAKAEVALIDADGTVLYQGSLKQTNGVGTAFNVATLPDGQYYLTATNDTFWFSQGLTISNNRLTVNENMTQEAVQPTLTAYDRNKFEVMMPTKNVSNVKLAIYNANDELVYQDSFRNHANRRFNLDGLPTGNYTVFVGPSEKLFSQHVVVRR